MLFKLVKYWQRPNDTHYVISLSDEGELGARLRDVNARVLCLGMSLGRPNLKGILKFLSIIRRVNPDLIQGWMYHGNLAASLAKLLACRKAIVFWNIRQSLVDISYEKKLTQWMVRLGKDWGGSCDVIIYNSHTSKQQHERLGYKKDKSIVIPNGFDLEKFSRDDLARSEIRAELNIPDKMLVLGMVARFHPMKDHSTFAKAVRLIIDRFPNVVIVMAGKGINIENSVFMDSYNDIPSHNIRFLGVRNDLPKLFNSFDVLCLASAWGEAFPNVLGEAMSCQVPCVTTDVGDCSFIVGDTGLIVPPQDEYAFSESVCKLLSLTSVARRNLGAQARSKVVNEYSIQSIVERYQGLYVSSL